MKKVTMILMAIVALTMTANAQWALQTNPLGSGHAAMVGKIQFVSATEGWIACGSSGSLLHTTDGGSTWNIATPFPGDVVGSMSDPATTMSWTNSTHGWALKTHIVGTGDITSSGNGAVLYNTTDGGSSWAKKEFPKTITTVTYSTADLQGSWQMHELVVNNPSSSNKYDGWVHGTLTLDATGSGSETNVVATDGSKSDVSGVSLQISSVGKITVGSSSDLHGFMSADKNTIFITETEEKGGGYCLIVLQKNVSTTYSLSDLQGTWQMHGLSAGNSSGDHAGWVHAILTGDAGGNLTGNFVGVGGGGSINTTASISSSGIITGMSSIGSNVHGFMSADKKTFYITMTGSENSDYNLVTFQKQVTGTAYATADLQGIWQLHALVSDNISDTDPWASWTHAKITLNASGAGSLSDYVVNNESRDDVSPSMSMTSDGIISFDSIPNSHGFLSADKSIAILTMPDMGSGGYTLGIMQKDVSISGDIGLQTQFVDNNNGWMSDYNGIYEKFIIYKTTNGGDTWNTTSNTVGGIYYFVNATNGWMIGTSVANVGSSGLNNIYHTTNGGANWALQASNIGSANAIYFSDLLHGWVVGEGALAMKTTDGGTHWSSVTTTGQTSNSNSKTVFFLDANHGWIGSSYDSGNNDVPTPTIVPSGIISSKLKGISKIKTDGVGTRFVLATKDGGATWETQQTPVTNDIFSMFFWDATNGWFTSDYGQIAHYTYTPPKTVNITAGGLSATLTASEKSSLKSLTVTGTIDARDFKTMRDDMPLLAEIDLSGATVTEYTGTLGTFYDASITTYPANTIPQRAFYYTATKTGKTSLTSFIFPASVTDIGMYAFRSSGLTSISIPSTLTAIGYGNFVNCINLTSVVIPSSISTIGDYAFQNCVSLISVSIPSTVTEIGYAAFFASGLQQITLNEGLKKIGDYAFQDCHSLQSISIPFTVTEIGYAAFLASGLQQINLNDGLKKIGDYAFIYCYPLQSISIPSTVTEIGNGAFNSSGLQQITLNEGLKTIGDYAFQWCDSLRSITIPSTVTNIGYCAFTFVNSLETITVASGNSNYYSEDGVLFDKTKKRLIAYPANKSPHYDIPLGVTVIDTAAFEGNWSLRSVTIPSSVTDLAPEAFYRCDLLSVIDLPSSISKIGNYCFYACYNLSAIFTNTQTPFSMVVSDSIFKEINAGCTLYVPLGSAANYRASEGWNHYITRIKEYDKVTDNEGNVYHGIQVGTQSWLVENLRAKHYNNNESIQRPSNPNVDLTYLPSANYVWDVENDPANAYVYGRLYTWNAAMDSRGICPAGWRLPSISDWQTLMTYVKNNSSTSQTKALASSGLWYDDPDAPENTPSYNISTNNESGLLIFPSGIRHTEGSFEGLWGVSYLWSSEIQDGLPYAYSIGNLATSVNGGPNRAQEGFTVRCVKDGNMALGDVKNGKMIVYPSPTSDAFQIKGIEGTATATVSDLNGRILISKEITANESVSVGTLSNGMYLITIKLNNTKTTEKLIIQH